MKFNLTEEDVEHVQQLLLAEVRNRHLRRCLLMKSVTIYIVWLNKRIKYTFENIIYIYFLIKYEPTSTINIHIFWNTFSHWKFTQNPHNKFAAFDSYPPISARRIATFEFELWEKVRLFQKCTRTKGVFAWAMLRTFPLTVLSRLRLILKRM